MGYRSTNVRKRQSTNDDQFTVAKLDDRNKIRLFDKCGIPEITRIRALVKGAFEPFLWLDPEDHAAKGVRLTAASPGKYQAVMTMGDYIEPVEYIENVSVYVNGTKQKAAAYTTNNGYIVFDTPPPAGAVVTADYTYWWKVMFKDDGVTIETVFENINKTKSFKLTTVR